MKNKIDIKNKEDMKQLLKNLEGKNLNFLIGAGASMPFLKSLSLGDSDSYTFEDLFECSIKEDNELCTTYLSNAFLCNSIIDGIYYKINGIYDDVEKNLNDGAKPICTHCSSCHSVLQNYLKWIENILRILDSNSINKPKRGNIFNTNYDMFVESAIDRIAYNNHNINFNDGSVGFIKKIVSTQKFHYKTSNVGVDDRFEYELPMINLIKLHGSVNWKYSDDRNSILIENEFLNIVKYSNTDIYNIGELLTSQDLNKSNKIETVISTLESILNSKEYSSSGEVNFEDKFNEMAIVRPTKGKFAETVFEEHYYQSLRIFTQELERNQTVLIVFGFSFEDEHILSIIKRSLNNPSLMIYIFVYDKSNISSFKEKFSCYKNIRYVCNCISESSADIGLKGLRNDKCDFNFFNECLGAQDYE